MLPRFLLTLILAVSASAQVPLGATKEEVINMLGWPKSDSWAGGREILNYSNYSVLLVDGKVEKLEFKPKPGKLPAAYKPPTPKPAQLPTPGQQLGPTSGPVEVRPALSSGPIQLKPVTSSPANQRTGPVPQAVVRERPDPLADARLTLIWTGLILGVALGLKYCVSHAFSREENADELYSKPFPGAGDNASATGLWPESARAPDARPTGWSLALLKEVEWHRFEHVVASYEQELGNDADLTDFGPDGGIDIRVFEKNSRTPKRIIQCKAFDNKPVDVKLVRELLGVMVHEKAPQGAFYTTSAFTPPALEFAQDHLELDLVDGPTFLNRVVRLTPAAQQRLIEVATEGDYTTPTCPSCGVKMVLRTAGRGRSEGSSFYGCRNYPRCKQTFRLSQAD